MVLWIEEVFLPHLDSLGRREDEWALLILDPATSHRAELVKEVLKQHRIAVAMMPASTTHKFQMIDVVIGKPFKDALCDIWADWMLEQCERRGVTPAGNYKSPTRTEINSWVAKAWKNLKMNGVKKAAHRLGMSADPGEPVEGYVPAVFKDVAPRGAEEEYGDRELWQDLERAAREDDE